MQQVYIGIDMGATHTRICLMNRKNEVLNTKRYKTDRIISQGLILGISQLCHQFCQQSEVRAIVIGLPATLSANRRQVLSAPNLALAQRELDNLVPHLSAQFHCKVWLERDVNLQLIYDVSHYQLTQQLVLGIYLGTGVGFAIWHQQTLFVGANGVAGELGHIPLGEDSLPCRCGNYGCLETLCSGIILTDWYQAQPRHYPLEQLFRYAQGERFIQDYLRQLAKATSTAINLFDPHAVILGGGVMDMQGFPLEQLISLIMQYVRKPLPYHNLNIYPAASSQFNGAIGAALWAKQQEEMA